MMAAKGFSESASGSSMPSTMTKHVIANFLLLSLTNFFHRSSVLLESSEPEQADTATLAKLVLYCVSCQSISLIALLIDDFSFASRWKK